VCESLNACYVQSPVDPNWPPRPAPLENAQQDEIQVDTIGMRPESYRIKRATGSKKKEGMVTIAQITDVHLELDYLEVSER